MNPAWQTLFPSTPIVPALLPQETMTEEDQENSVPIADLPPSRGRTYYSIRAKIQVAEEAVKIRAEGKALKPFAREKGIDPAVIRRWIKSLPTLKKHSFRKLCKLTMHVGHSPDFSKPAELVEWVQSLRKQGMAVSINMAVLQAGLMDASFRRKTKVAKYASIRRVMRAAGIVVRAKTHTAQTAPQEMIDEAIAFVHRLVPVLNAPNRDQAWIANMDQTPVFFSMEPSTTLNQRGENEL